MRNYKKGSNKVSVELDIVDSLTKEKSQKRIVVLKYDIPNKGDLILYKGSTGKAEYYFIQDKMYYLNSGIATLASLIVERRYPETKSTHK